MKLSKIGMAVVGVLLMQQAFSQHRDQAQEYINTLASDEYSGRGYIDQGDKKAADFIASKFEQIGLTPLTENYFQPFVLSVNTITHSSLSFDGNVLEPGIDYMVSPSSPNTSIASNIFFISEAILNSAKAVRKVKKAIRKGYIPVFDNVSKNNELARKHINEIQDCIKLKVFIQLTNDLTYSVARTQEKPGAVYILKSAFSGFEKTLNLDIIASLIPAYETQNVMGYVPGTAIQDSFIIFCGHYDHLGKMGEAIYHGANDNASGIAMLLDMAEYFKKKPQKYSVLFIAFGAEEAGLIGSQHFVFNTPEGITLPQIKFVFNMDLMGSGEDGATIVNGSVFKDEFNALVKINEEHDYLPKIKSRGKAANSDHYFFSEQGVPAFFIYLMGGYTYYHIPQDNAENLTLTEYYDKSFLLIRDFIIQLNN